MIYPQVDLEKWKETYHLNEPDSACLKCGKAQKFTVPFASGKFRGLLSDHTECGDEFRQSIATSTDKDWNGDIDKIINYVNGLDDKMIVSSGTTDKQNE